MSLTVEVMPQALLTMQQKSCQIHYGSDCQKRDARENLENQLGGTSVSSYICFCYL